MTAPLVYHVSRAPVTADWAYIMENYIVLPPTRPRPDGQLWERVNEYPPRQTITEGFDANCLQAAVAAALLIGMSEVPNFALFRTNWFDALMSWCEVNGYDITLVNAAHVPEERVLAFGQSHRGHRHAVVWKRNRLWHDPHPDNSGLATIEEFWLIDKQTS